MFFRKRHFVQNLQATTLSLEVFKRKKKVSVSFKWRSEVRSKGVKWMDGPKQKEFLLRSLVLVTNVCCCEGFRGPSSVPSAAFNTALGGRNDLWPLGERGSIVGTHLQLSQPLSNGAVVLIVHLNGSSHHLTHLAYLLHLVLHFL